jgi:hypothetical protein
LPETVRHQYPYANHNRDKIQMKLNPNSKPENKLLSLRQFIEHLREQYVFAIEIVSTDKDQITIQLLREDL